MSTIEEALLTHAAALNRVADALIKSIEAASETPVEDETEEIPKKKKASKKATVTLELTPEEDPEENEEEDPEENEEEGDDEVTDVMLRALVTKLVDAKKAKLAKACVAVYGVGRLSEVDEDDYEELYAALQKAVKKIKKG